MSPPAQPRETVPQVASHVCGPRSLRELFWAFSLLSLQGFGGVLAVVHRELVEKRRWLSEERFIEDWALAQVMPGPNVCNLALMIGDRSFGLRGAAVALLGLLLLPALLLISAAASLQLLAGSAAVDGALRGMGAVAAGLILGATIKLFVALRRHPLGRSALGVLALAAFAASAWLHWPLHLVVLVVGGLACGLTWRALRRVRNA
jgi:chromate transporter